MAADFYRVGQDGDGGNLFVRFPKAAEQIEAMQPGAEAHVRVYDDARVEIDIESGE